MENSIFYQNTHYYGAKKSQAIYHFWSKIYPIIEASEIENWIFFPKSYSELDSQTSSRSKKSNLKIRCQIDIILPNRTRVMAELRFSPKPWKFSIFWPNMPYNRYLKNLENYILYQNTHYYGSRKIWKFTIFEAKFIF